MIKGELRKYFLGIILAVLTCGASTLMAKNSSDGHLMVSPGAKIFSETFEKGNISRRWGIKQYYIIEDGVLKRSRHMPHESARIFLKEAAFHNVIFQFDFMFKGASELRLVTGGDGGYNTITLITPKHFQVNTASRKGLYEPSRQGECAMNFKKGIWYTMNIEFYGDEVVAHVDNEHFVVGRHPIIDTERTYTAFQVEGSSAHFDNFMIWESKPKSNWEALREKLAATQATRGPAIDRDVIQEEKYLSIVVKDKLSRTDSDYRSLVALRDKLNAEIKAAYPKAFQTHKELSKSVAKKKSALKNDQDYKKTKTAIIQAGKAVKAYVHSLHPELGSLPRYQYHARYEARKKAMAQDPELLKLEAAIVQREKEQVAAFPEAFQDTTVLVEKRKAYAASLKKNPTYQARKREIADAVHAIENYIYTIEPRLRELKAAITAAKKAGDRKKSKKNTTGVENASTLPGS